MHKLSAVVRHGSAKSAKAYLERRRRLGWQGEDYSINSIVLDSRSGQHQLAYLD